MRSAKVLRPADIPIVVTGRNASKGNDAYATSVSSSAGLPYPAPMFNPPEISSSITERPRRMARTGFAPIVVAHTAAVVAAILGFLSCAGSPPPPKTPQAVATQPAAPAPPPPPPVILLPVDVARASLIATVVAPTLEGALDSGLALARQAVPLPLDKAAVREMALNQIGVPPEIGVQLDLAAPISGAVVASGHGERVFRGAPEKRQSHRGEARDEGRGFPAGDRILQVDRVGVVGLCRPPSHERQLLSRRCPVRALAAWSA